MTTEPRILITVSGVIPKGLPDAIAAGVRPRADYLELARGLRGRLLDVGRARRLSPKLARLLERLGGPALLLAYFSWVLRRRFDIIVTDGEQVGLPLAALFRVTPGPRPRHAMIVHILSTPKKALLLDVLALHRAIDSFIVYCTFQKEFIEKRWGVGPRRILMTPFMVDQEFFKADKVIPNKGARPRICAVGLERRDYATLLRAVDGLDVDVVIAAASPWSRRRSQISEAQVPSNVTVAKFNQHDLRQLYADCAFLVMPLEIVDFQAGITAILEAMAMGKPVLCTRTPGQTDIIREGVDGGYVEPGDVAGLARKIKAWLADPEKLQSMGREARSFVETDLNLDAYVSRIGAFLDLAVEDAPRQMREVGREGVAGPMHREVPLLNQGSPSRAKLN